MVPAKENKQVKSMLTHDWNIKDSYKKKGAFVFNFNVLLFFQRKGPVVASVLLGDDWDVQYLSV